MDDVRALAREKSYDAIVVGTGPNGLAAAVLLAGEGLRVLVVEARDTIGGGARTAELTEPGFRHDVCSAIHPTAVVSPFLSTLPLAAHGVEWIYPPVPFAHPLPDGSAAACVQSLDEMEATLGSADARAWRALYAPFVARKDALFADLLAPFSPIPRAPLSMLSFGLLAMRSASGLSRARFSGEHARALFAGAAAHSFLPLERPFTAAFGIVLALAAHAVGWPCVRGGSQAIVDALAAILRARGGEIVCGRRVGAMDELPEARAFLFDTSPRALARVAGDRLPASYAKRLEAFRHGPGAFKIDYALSGPIPWTAEPCRRAGTVHVGGTLDEVAASERAAWTKAPSDRPFVLVAQQSLFDPTRAPAGKHTGWAYCHVPHGFAGDVASALEGQIERFAPGFRDLVIARHVTSATSFEAYNENYVGGDITGGDNAFDQIFTRPVSLFTPYATPNRAIYLCSASTPPGGGVHGMCGYFAARAALKRVFGRAPRAPAALPA
jgi:phytoene dehydrogenase-like protein